MNWCIVRQPNGLYARYSDAVGDFTCFNKTREEATNLCLSYRDGTGATLTPEVVQTMLDGADQCGLEGWQVQVDNVRKRKGAERAGDAARIGAVPPSPPELRVVEPDRHIAIRRILMPRDQNHHGVVFGGALLAEIDLAGAVEARQHTRHDVVTRFMNGIEFKQPVSIGDVVTFYTTLVKIGNTSITVKVEIEASRNGEEAPVAVTCTEIVYVTVQKNAEGNLQKVPVRG